MTLRVYAEFFSFFVDFKSKHQCVPLQAMPWLHYCATQSRAASAGISCRRRRLG